MAKRRPGLVACKLQVGHLHSGKSIPPRVKISVFTYLHRNTERTKSTQKWPKSDSGRPTPKWPKIDSKVTQDPIFESISSHFWVISSHSGVGPQESLLSHFSCQFNSFHVLVQLGARPHLKPREFAEQFKGATGHGPVKETFWGNSHQKVHQNVRQHLCHTVSLWYLLCPQWLADDIAASRGCIASPKACVRIGVKFVDWQGPFLC